MAIEKSYYTNGEAPPVEEEMIIEVENPDSVTVMTDDMAMEMDFNEENQTPDTMTI